MIDASDFSRARSFLVRIWLESVESSDPAVWGMTVKDLRTGRVRHLRGETDLAISVDFLHRLSQEEPEEEQP